jgi:hypothetical protein
MTKQPVLGLTGDQHALVHGWVWDRMKTKKGCDSYWEGECHPDYWKKRGYKW